MTCEVENWQAKAAFSDIVSIIKLHSRQMDYFEMSLVNVKVGTKKEKELEELRAISEEVYDRLHDLADMVNVKENDDCDEDNCNCH